MSLGRIPENVEVVWRLTDDGNEVIVKEQPYPYFKELIRKEGDDNLKEADRIQLPYLKHANCK